MMKAAQPRAATTRLRRREILLGALECFSRDGFAATSMGAIRRQSRASTGSIYHHFKSKQQLAAALYVEGLRDYQQGLLRLLARQRRADQGVRVIVRYHLDWIAKHPDWARYLLQMGQAEQVRATQGEIRDLNRGFLAEIGKWFDPRIERGELVRLPMELYAAILTGPSQLFARQWLDRGTAAELRRARRELGEAAWRSLRARGEKGER